MNENKIISFNNNEPTMVNHKLTYISYTVCAHQILHFDFAVQIFVLTEIIHSTRTNTLKLQTPETEKSQKMNKTKDSSLYNNQPVAESWGSSQFGVIKINAEKTDRCQKPYSRCCAIFRRRNIFFFFAIAIPRNR